MKRAKKLIAVIFFTLLIFLTWTRIWRIDKTFEFFSDTGRDHYVLIRAFQTRKPPLLGPSNGAMPFNQSPIYFYLNVPVFLLTNASPYTTSITLTILYLGSFLVGVYIFRNNTKVLILLGILILLITLHPQFIEQHRHPWNPTFTVPFLLVSMYMVLKKNLEYRGGRWLFAGGIAFALGCSYSVFPTALTLAVYVIWSKKASIRQLLFPFFGTHFLIFLPLLLVELRSQFMMTKRMILEIQLHEIGSRVNYGDKVRALFAYLVGTNINNWLTIGIVFGVLAVSIFLCLRAKGEKRNSYHLFFSALFGLSFLLTILSPFRLEPHYIFGVLLLFLLTVASMKRFLLIPLVLFIFSIWIPQLNKQLFQVPHRTIASLDSCAKAVCAKQKDPLYVSVQAWHSYHYAPDYMFFFNKHGCFARDVTQDPGVAIKMAVVSDNSSYEHGKTAFNELTLFGPATLEDTYQCEGNIVVNILKEK